MASNAVDVINQEYARLQTKKTTIDTALSGQSRAIFLNESYRKRFSRYTKIVVIISLALMTYLGIVALRKAVPIIPELATDLFMGLVLAICFIYIIFILLEINSRSLTDYDELYLYPYDAADPNNTSTDAGAPKSSTAGGSGACDASGNAQ
jgi:hypothetical protein